VTDMANSMVNATKFYL